MSGYCLDSLADTTSRNSGRRQDSSCGGREVGTKRLAADGFASNQPAKEEDMELKCVVAIVRPDVVEVLERKLGAIHIHGVTVTRVRGFGAHPNLFADDWTTEHVKIEIFAQVENVDALVSAIMDIARVCSAGDGVIAVIPVERFFRVRTASEALP